MQSFLHTYDHKCIVLFTLPFHFQLNKSQNIGFHLKLFSDFIFDLVMSPWNDLKLISLLYCTLWMHFHVPCTPYFHITLSRSCEVIEKWAVMFSWSTGVLSDWKACAWESQATNAMKSISGKVICTLCSVITDKQKFLIWVLTPSIWYAFWTAVTSMYSCW